MKREDAKVGMRVKRVRFEKNDTTPKDYGLSVGMTCEITDIILWMGEQFFKAEEFWYPLADFEPVEELRCTWCGSIVEVRVFEGFCGCMHGHEQGKQCRKKLNLCEKCAHLTCIAVAYCPEHVDEHRPKVYSTAFSKGISEIAAMLPPRPPKSDEQSEKDFIESLQKKPIETLAEDQKDLAPAIVKAVNENIHELLGYTQAAIVRGSTPNMCYGEIRRYAPTLDETKQAENTEIERRNYPQGG
jgi:hypothetical protein